MEDARPTETQTELPLEPYGLDNLGPVKTGDVLIVRYRNNLTPHQQRGYYDSLRTFFRDRGIHPRIIGVIGHDVTLEKLSVEEMAAYGWRKDR